MSLDVAQLTNDPDNARRARFHLRQGLPYPLGATVTKDGVNFAVFSAHADQIDLCIFTDDGMGEIARIRLPDRTGDIWHGHVDGLRAGTRYGFRVHGPYRPEEGHRFNPNKLLIDPYAKALHGELIWSDAIYGYNRDEDDLSFSTLDSAPYVPKSIVVDTEALRPRMTAPPKTPLNETVIYEAHVKGLTQTFPKLDDFERGKFIGVGDTQVIQYLNDLGITAIELLPVHFSITDQFLQERNLTNYWGYQSIAFFAPDPRFLAHEDIAEFQHMVARLHEAGIETLLDVVYNHTGEGNHLGPTICHRGFDNKSYYRLADDPRFYVNNTGTGNMLNLAHPMVLRMVMDSLRYWVEIMHVDGFRFDLATTLARDSAGNFSKDSNFLHSLTQDPILQSTKLIAEPWDIGYGGYQLGNWPSPFLEWNDKFRDTVRRFWRGDSHQARDLAGVFLGSAKLFDHSGRRATSSVNFVTSHDGFTMRDVTSFSTHHNWQNNEGNRDGHSENVSDNFGVEGPSDDPEIRAARARRQRNFFATLLFAQGTPMILAGDEIGNSQFGNNNAYAQDNETGWVTWRNADNELRAFVKKLIHIRKHHPVLRQGKFLHSRPLPLEGLVDLYWWRKDGVKPTPEDWNRDELRLVIAEMRMNQKSNVPLDPLNAAIVVLNAGEATDFVLPPPPENSQWQCLVDTSEPNTPAKIVKGNTGHVPAHAVLLFTPLSHDPFFKE